MKTKRYAIVSWAPEDVMDLCEDMTREDAKDFLERNEGHITDRLVELGYEVIETLLAMDEPNPREKGDDDGVEYGDPRDEKDDRL